MSNKKYPTHKIKPNSDKLEFRIEEIAFNNHYNVNAPHAHEYYEIFLFKTGGGKHTIDFKENPIDAFSIHLVLPGQIHQVGRQGSCTGLVMVFSKSYISSNPALLETINQFPFLNHQNEAYIKTIPTETFHYFFETVSKVLTDNASNGFNSKAIIQSYLNILLLKTQEVFSEEKTKLSPITQKLFHLLDKNCTNLLKSDELAAQLSISLSTLTSTTTKELGKSVKQLIKERLLIEIKKQLLLTNNSIKTISYEFDFSDPSNFNKFFKRETGMTPLDFRKNKN